MIKLRALLLHAVIILFSVGPAIADEQDGAALEMKVYNSDAASFHVNSVLLTGKRDAILIDAQFTRAHAHRLVAEILDSRKNLIAVYISHGDPDYYFGLEIIKQEFPDVKVYASSPTVSWIKKTVDKKVAFWGPKMGMEAPLSPVIPAVLPGNSLDLEGHKLEVVGLNGEQPQRSFVWIPALKAIVGGVNVFAGLHLWTADTQSKEEREAWAGVLDRMIALNPDTVVSGHAAVNAPQDASQITYSLDYLKVYEKALEKTETSESLIKLMQQAYPDAKLEIALDIGAKVNKGEMKW
ncbi:MBL fold metallo-hydrolase [Motiliproteus sp. MSK22-1]|uniref:MBL fold metallo-hydrolase n=1 Tax=Motiliproteus sp. MSK22-1 TaxID=1897630 RepID=UPI000976390D|nr:MBL fold metallo-hydrolase [Motiliproteus sp. MSK22-1]OMH29431.1 MBL fold metallo-hydrolase [Motiliproteus sp. MSK22-1]